MPNMWKGIIYQELPENTTIKQKWMPDFRLFKTIILDISINNILLVMICHSFLEISGFLKNKFNLHFLFNFPFFIVGFNM
jgi:hypothetical protein